ncbi:MAG: 30S ribosomal protein S20 [Tepidisphaeraceae bacterium]
MAHSLSAKKRIRQSLKRRARNRARKSVLKDQIRVYLTIVAGGDATKAEAEFRKTASRLDQVAASGTIHKNTASRKRSRLARRLNAMRNAKPVAKAPTGKGGAKAKA